MLFDMAIDLWLVLAPQWEEPADPAAGAGTSADDAAPADGTAAACPESDTAAVFKGYLVEASYFWHCEDNAFSIAWHQVLPESVADDRRDQDLRREAEERLRHASLHAPRPGDAG